MDDKNLNAIVSIADTNLPIKSHRLAREIIQRAREIAIIEGAEIAARNVAGAIKKYTDPTADRIDRDHGYDASCKMMQALGVFCAQSAQTNYVQQIIYSQGAHAGVDDATVAMLLGALRPVPVASQGDIIDVCDNRTPVDNPVDGDK